CFYYITTLNENYSQPDMPKGVEEGIIRGLYRLEKAAAKAKKVVQLVGCGAILREVRAAAELLRSEYGVEADVFSMTSANELRREGLACERWNLLHPEARPRRP